MASIERVDRFLRRTTRPAGRDDRVPEGTCSQPELDAAGAEQVERGGTPRQDHRRPQRQVGHVGRHPDRAWSAPRSPTAASRCRGACPGRGGPGPRPGRARSPRPAAPARGSARPRRRRGSGRSRTAGRGRSPASLSSSVRDRAQSRLQPQHGGNSAGGDRHSQPPLQRAGGAAGPLDVVEAHGVQCVGAYDGQAGARHVPGEWLGERVGSVEERDLGVRAGVQLEIEDPRDRIARSPRRRTRRRG